MSSSGRLHSPGPEEGEAWHRCLMGSEGLLGVRGHLRAMEGGWDRSLPHSPQMEAVGLPVSAAVSPQSSAKILLFNPRLQWRCALRQPWEANGKAPQKFHGDGNERSVYFEKKLKPMLVFFLLYNIHFLNFSKTYHMHGIFGGTKISLPFDSIF